MKDAAHEAYAVWRKADQILSELSEASHDYWRIRILCDELGELCLELADEPPPGSVLTLNALEAIRRAYGIIDHVQWAPPSDTDLRETTLRFAQATRPRVQRLLEQQMTGSAEYDQLLTAVATLEQVDSILNDASATSDVIYRCRSAVNDTRATIARLTAGERQRPVRIAVGAGDDANEANSVRLDIQSLLGGGSDRATVISAFAANRTRDAD